MGIGGPRIRPARVLQGVFVALLGSGLVVSLLSGRALVPSILLGTWMGAVGAAVSLVGIVFYLGFVCIRPA